MIPLFKPYLHPTTELFSELSTVIDSGYISDGDTVKEFERQFGERLDNPRAVATNSCTSALHIALILADAQPGTEVISTPMTAVPTNMAIMYTGAKLIWADVDPNTGNIDWNDAVSKVTIRTRAIVCVDYAGVPCHDESMWNIPSFVSVIEDAAHALGASWNGAMIGSEDLVDFTCFSFQAIKHLTTVDGGMLMTNSRAHDEAARRLRWFGFNRANNRLDDCISEVGYKYNMNNVTAAIGLVNLRHIDDVIQRHISNGEYYDSQISTIPGVSTVEIGPRVKPSYWLYTLLAETEVDRDDLSRRLTEAGIANGVVHKRNDLHSVFAASGCHLPGLDSFYSRMLHIPCGWWVTDENREYIVETIRC